MGVAPAFENAVAGSRTGVVAAKQNLLASAGFKQSLVVLVGSIYMDALDEHQTTGSALSFEKILERDINALYLIQRDLFVHEKKKQKPVEQPSAAVAP